MNIYLASSWRNTEQQRVLGLLQANGHRVYGFRLDMRALEACEACVLLLPCGRSAHLEAGWAVGAGRRVVVYTRDGEEPELMYKMCSAIVSTDSELISVLR